MALEFKELRDRVTIIEVLAARGIKLRHKMGSEYASGPCPLRVHPKDDRGNSFGIHLPTNRFQCKNATCQKENGVGDKWGDCINLLAGMEGVELKVAARQLDEMFPKEKPAIPKNSGVTGSPRTSSVAVPSANTLEASTVSGSGKGFIASLDGWFNELFQLGEELVNDPFWIERRKAVKAKVYESFQNGKLAAKT
jgi:hypothetical protein